MNQVKLKAYSTDFFPTKEDIVIAYSVLNFFRGEYCTNMFSNMDNCFSNVLHVLENKYSKFSV